MKKYITVLSAMLLTIFATAQNTLTEGAKLLFGQVASKLTTAEKNDIYKQTGFLLSADKKQFILDKESADYPFEAMVYPTDLNGDGKEEVFLFFGNTFTSGHTGSSIVMFIKNSAGQYQMNLGFPGVVPDALATGSGGYPDLLIGGPGFEYPVWRWNGKAYQFHKKVKDADLNKLKKTSIETISQAYTKASQ